MSNPANKVAAIVKPNDQPAVLFKLILFTVLMAVVPIGTYFGTLKFNGKWSFFLSLRTTATSNYSHRSTTISAIAAIVAANIILVGYVVVAFREDAGYTPNPPIELKKNR
ncbi:hypothetical protein CI109_107018 [Kwoniella shandongensis]|uniref:Uncharacterized protein n=1 Tax=Kwoniella shandongensis TaxID=1734106 RepID=A0A5M6BQF8_9TREE|nr:uncharacterized protein CI109_007325 [Kwoniella shandongensis]KAA5524342.1 hypothetical protein CI109_007325 [Kwoniella shandongensis]